MVSLTSGAAPAVGGRCTSVHTTGTARPFVVAAACGSRASAGADERINGIAYWAIFGIVYLMINATSTFQPATVAARFGRTSRVVHAAAGRVRLRHGRPLYEVITTVPACNTYTRVGGAALAVYEPITCEKCLARLAEHGADDLAEGVELAE
ncbi:hypothetical protein PBI_BIGNUZ_70 [Mycobacterium phage BigNuz]|uniref:Uncharacterized protein n=1 Tax=Mycobacterium phage BigNuz TaxID=1074309 RepID=G1JX85_9CAUD|nr:hypothetical protein PBI_BIGNUZ_70 [Mycobacterium phage BigNuz]AEL98232.1 hypothetical protein PBI_BIGNUZ_70 [Mycobacterium phage BigNuz]